MVTVTHYSNFLEYIYSGPKIDCRYAKRMCFLIFVTVHSEGLLDIIVSHIATIANATLYFLVLVRPPEPNVKIM